MRLSGGRDVAWQRPGWMRLTFGLGLALAVFALSSLAIPAGAQENPLDNVQTPAPPPPPKSPEDAKPVIEGGSVAAEATSHPGARAAGGCEPGAGPGVTVTDPIENRLGDGPGEGELPDLRQQPGPDHQVFSPARTRADHWDRLRPERQQSSKFLRARKALTEFLHTCNRRTSFSWWASTTGRR